MGRNLFRRIEVAFPVLDPELKARVDRRGARALPRRQSRMHGNLRPTAAIARCGQAPGAAACPRSSTCSTGWRSAASRTPEARRPTMDLILWRHAEAEPGEPDLGRRLTAKGIQQAERMAEVARPPSAGDDARAGESGRSRAADGARAEAQVPRRARARARARRRRRCWTPRDGRTRASPCSSSGISPRSARWRRSCLTGEEAPWSVRKGAVWWLSHRVRDGVASTVLKVVIGPDFV